MGSQTPTSSTSIPSANNTAQKAQLAELKKQHKKLTQEKGKLSRLIGENKKSEKPIEHLLEQMRTLSAELKELEAQQKKLKLPANASSIKPEQNAVKPASFPSHIYHKTTTNPPPQYEIISIPEAPDETWHQNWNQFVDQQRHACIYHRYEFRQIIEQSFGHNTLYLAAVDSDNIIHGILPAVHTRSLLFGSYITTMPFFNYGGPLATSPAIEEALIQALAAEAQKRQTSHVEIRETQPRDNYPARTDKVSMFLALPDSPEILWTQIGSKLRAQIKKGQSNGFKFKTGKQALLNDFYQVFSTNMRDLGTPVYSKSFFRNILDKSEINSTLAILYYQQKPVSCAFLLGYKDTMEIPWASTLREVNHLNSNMVLYWKVLGLAITSKYRFFDFGRSSKSANTYKFKKQWGAQAAPLYWHYWLADGDELPHINPANPKYQLMIKVWQQLPLWLANLIGPPVVRNLP